ncbi:hypothetical protein [Streptomyces sp. H39-S7]|uniref:hypothetical protein n=1 Tax=Streptomyces sp. H39-S7 TaxID=3004357 RepID=UPI0022B00C29|nr:hypothetical protein [Streptomyces sp. H39-S7]MCZ4118991.1 hypothetical protein [Streptomyces sp. H39-S7]
MEDAQLPAGWSLQQIRDRSGDLQATALSTDRRVIHCPVGDLPEEVLVPEIVLGFHGLAIVKAIGDDDWYRAV